MDTCLDDARRFLVCGGSNLGIDVLRVVVEVQSLPTREVEQFVSSCNRFPRTMDGVCGVLTERAFGDRVRQDALLRVYHKLITSVFFWVSALFVELMVKVPLGHS